MEGLEGEKKSRLYISCIINIVGCPTSSHHQYCAPTTTHYSPVWLPLSTSPTGPYGSRVSAHSNINQPPYPSYFFVTEITATSIPFIATMTFC